MPVLILAWLDEEFHLHLLKLTRTEDEVTWGNFITERLTDIGDTKRWLHTRRGHDVFEVDEDTLCGFRTQVVQALFIIDWTKEGLQQTGECLWLRPFAWLTGFWVIDICQTVCWWVAVLFFVSLQQVVSAVALVGVQGLHQWIGEDFDVTGRNPGLGGLDDGRINTDDVITGLHHVTPPLALDVFLEFYTQGTVVPGRARSAVDLASLVHQATTLTKIYDRINH